MTNLGGDDVVPLATPPISTSWKEGQTRLRGSKFLNIDRTAKVSKRLVRRTPVVKTQSVRLPIMRASAVADEFSRDVKLAMQHTWNTAHLVSRPRSPRSAGAFRASTFAGKRRYLKETTHLCRRNRFNCGCKLL
jgi:hypothetical protein